MLRPRLVAAFAAMALPLAAGAQGAPFTQLAARCAPGIDPTTLAAVVRTESSFNPFAIGVVGRHLARQPHNLDEALATADALRQQGANFSLGWAQVNRFNLLKLGETYAGMFEPCRNLKAGGAILQACYRRAKGQFTDQQQALRAAFSCYYSGNFRRGFQPDGEGQPSYVQKVVANALGAAPPVLRVPAVQRLSAEDLQPVPVTQAPASGAAATAAAPWVVIVGAEPIAPPTGAAADRVLEKPMRRPPATAGQDTVAVAKRAPGNKHRFRPPQPFVQFVDE